MKKLKFLVFICVLGSVSTLQSLAQVKPAKVIPAAEHYTGGQDSMYAFINTHLKYPPMAKRNRIEGECIIKFKIDENGHTSDYGIVKNVGGGCGEEALRVVKLLKFNAPGYQMQTSVPVIYSIKSTK